MNVSMLNEAINMGFVYINVDGSPRTQNKKRQEKARTRKKSTAVICNNYCVLFLSPPSPVSFYNMEFVCNIVPLTINTSELTPEFRTGRDVIQRR